MFALLTALGVWPAVLRAQTPPLPASLPEDFLPGLRDILHSAMQESPQMISRNIDLAAQEANRYQQAAQQWPSLGGTAYYTENRSAVSSNTAQSTSSEGFFYSLNLNQPIYHWGALQAATDIAHLQIKISERQYADAYRQLAVMLRSEYLALVMQKSQLRNQRFALNQSKAALSRVEERVKHGAAVSNDVTNAQLLVDEASLAVDRLTENFLHAKRLLLLSAGLSDLSDDVVPEEIPKPVYPADTAVTLMQDFTREGVNSTFQAQIYDDEIKKDELSYKIAKYRLYPRLDLQLGASESNETQVIGNTVTQNPVFSNNITVAANWNIFDGLATRGAKLAALASKREDERERETYIDQTLEQARDLKQQMNSLRAP